MTTIPPHIQSLFATITSALESGRIGRPVSVRWMERVESDPGVAVGTALEIVSGWPGGKPASVVPSGGTVGSDLQSSVLVTWPGGESALLLAGQAGVAGVPGLDLAVIGARGALYHRV